jgi:L-rhamnose mutarotase
MQRICFTLQIDAAKLEAYRQAHAAVWPDMIDALRRHGWTNYSLFLRDDGLLIGYCETRDFDAAVAGMQDEPVNARWQNAMSEFFVDLPGSAPDAAARPLPEVFHLD